MSGKKSLLVDKSKMPLAMGIAFVAFTTQFGGGFASGAQMETLIKELNQYLSDLSVFYQLRNLVSVNATDHTRIICIIFLVWNALCIQTQNIRLQKFFRQHVW